ncbi:hypothetical protein CBS147332_8376 [Penicillium roqueforti]|nr:hypothetical protein CBS147332_8376 [Penicillium roqueforti]KAI3100048.1 hypothetical protein CBS147331_8419 [Penicillium roqueforti]
MAGYGKSLAPKGNWADYALEEITKDNRALLSHLGRDQAVWIGHDWGAGAVSAFVAHHPQRCQAMCLMSIPYRALDRGLVPLLQSVDRQRYPEAEYPYGQWACQVHYIKRGEEEVELFERNRNGVKFLTLAYKAGGPKNLAGPSQSSGTKGWLGEQDLPNIPTDKSLGFLDLDVHESLVEGAEKNGWFGAIAWYMNHGKNREYSEKDVPNGGELSQPFEEPMRKLCKDLTYVQLATGHFMAQEKPEEVNNGIEAWLKEKKIVPQVYT